MSNKIVLLEQKGAIAIVTLNRPETLNALSRDLRNEIAATFEKKLVWFQKKIDQQVPGNMPGKWY